MANINDKRIMALQTKIEEKRKEIGEKEYFRPLTKCQIDIDGTRLNIHTLDRKQSIALLVKLNVLFQSAKELGYEEELEFNGFNIQVWMTDLQEKIRLHNKDQEQKKLNEMEKHLHKLLSDDKKVELEIEGISKELSSL